MLPVQREHGEAESVTVTLRQLSLAVRLQQQRQMCKAWHCVLPAESFVKHDVQGSRRQPFLATDDVCNLHQVVIDDIGQMVGGQLVVSLIEHLVVANLTLDAHFATYHVIDENLLTRLNAEAYHPGVGLLHQTLHLFLRQCQ